jgi:hypothetical protein
MGASYFSKSLREHLIIIGVPCHCRRPCHGSVPRELSACTRCTELRLATLQRTLRAMPGYASWAGPVAFGAHAGQAMPGRSTLAGWAAGILSAQCTILI